MNLAVSVYSSVLFLLLTPSILVKLPTTGSKYAVALVHALIFGIIFYFTSSLVESSFSVEGFDPRTRSVGQSCTMPAGKECKGTASCYRARGRASPLTCNAN